MPVIGESPVRLWRGKRNLTQQALAAAADVSVSYLAEIEASKKPGSAVALRRIAVALDVPMENLVVQDTPTRPLPRRRTMRG